MLDLLTKSIYNEVKRNDPPLLESKIFDYSSNYVAKKTIYKNKKLWEKAKILRMRKNLAAVKWTTNNAEKEEQKLGSNRIGYNL